MAAVAAVGAEAVGAVAHVAAAAGRAAVSGGAAARRAGASVPGQETRGLPSAPLTCPACGRLVSQDFPSRAVALFLDWGSCFALGVSSSPAWTVCS